MRGLIAKYLGAVIIIVVAYFSTVYRCVIIPLRRNRYVC
jgi:hypothetical protein